TPGMVVEVGANGTANQAVTVSKVGSRVSAGTRTWWVEFTGTVTNALTTAAYAGLARYGATQVKSPTFGAGEGQQLIDYINTLPYFVADQATGTFTGALPDPIATLTAFKDLSAT